MSFDASPVPHADPALSEVSHNAVTPIAIKSPTLLTSPRKFVLAWMKAEGVSVTADGRLVGGKYDHYQPGEIVSACYEHLGELIPAFEKNEKQTKPHHLRIKAPSWPRRDLQVTFDLIITEAKIKLRMDTIAAIAFSGVEDVSQVSRFTRAIMGANAEPKAVAKTQAALCHFVCQVKRKLLGMPVHDHTMLVFVGPQGNGKSTALAQLTSILGQFSYSLRMPHLTDERYSEMIQNGMVGVLDELSRIKDVDVETLKYVITTDRLTYRALNGNKVIQVKQNLTLLGSSNRPLSEQINDYTGMRRFISVQTSSEKFDYATINSLDYTALWKNIDPKKDYYTPFRTEFEEDARAMTQIDPIAEWIREYRIEKPSEKECKRVSAADLYRAYAKASEEQGEQVKTAQWFFLKFANKTGLKSVPEKVNGRSIRFYRLNAECAIVGDLIVTNQLHAS